MSKEVLIIIGNGFDVFHGLPTKYIDFYRFIKFNYPEFFLEENEGLYPQIDEDIFWNDFETNISYVDSYYVQEVFSTGRFSIYYDSETKEEYNKYTIAKLNEERNKIIFLFNQWLNSIDILKCWYSNVDYNIFSYEKAISDEELYLHSSTNFLKVKKIFPNCKIINFNFTNTIELIYGVNKSKLMYIHNRINDKELIFGCSKEAYEYYKEFGYGFYENEEDRKNDYHHSQEAVNQFLEKTIKPCKKIISEKLHPYLNSINSFEFIFVMGHSLNQNDLDYFIYIASRYKTAKWIFSYYTETDKKNILSFVNKNNINNYLIDTMLNVLNYLITIYK